LSLDVEMTVAAEAESPYLAVPVKQAQARASQARDVARRR